MDFDDFEQDISAWGSKGHASTSSKDVVKDAVRKEHVIKEIVAGQADLRVLLQKINKVQTDVDNLESENSTLQMYIDNLTKQMARR